MLAPRSWTAAAAGAALCLLAVFAGPATGQQNLPVSPGIFANLQFIGTTGANPTAATGCADGTSMEYLGFWATADNLSGVTLRFSNGTTVTYGCQPNCNSDRYSDFTFLPGETISWMTLFPTNKKQEAGAVTFLTSNSRPYAFGMNGPWPGPTSATYVYVASGILCGVVSDWAGTTLNSLAMVFLLPVDSAVLQNVSYPQLSSTNAFQPGASISESLLRNVTLDNVKGMYPQVYQYSENITEPADAQWEQQTGLDVFLYATSNVTAGTPQLKVDTVSGNPLGWTVGQAGNHSRSEAPLVSQAWSYNQTVPAGAYTTVMAYGVGGDIQTPYNGIMVVTLSSGMQLSYPVQSTYKGSSLPPVVVQTEEVQVVLPTPASAPAASAPSPSGALSTAALAGSADPNSGGGSSDNTATIVGIVVGVLAALALVLVIFALLIHRRRRQDSSGKEVPVVTPQAAKPAPEPMQAAKLAPAPMQPAAMPGNAAEDAANGTAGSTRPFTAGGGVGEAGMPYSLYRMVRLDSIRRNLGLVPRSSGTPKYSLKSEHEGLKLQMN